MKAAGRFNSVTTHASTQTSNLLRVLQQRWDSLLILVKMSNMFGMPPLFFVESCPEVVVKVSHHTALSVSSSVQGPPNKSALFMRH